MGKLTNNQLTIKGKSGTEYKFDIYTLDTNFTTQGGIYVFTVRTKSTENDYSHNFVYCGKTENLSSRFENHHKQDCIKKNNANCICIKVVLTEKERTEIETDILKGNNFKCNEVLN